jgi:hypothetical protein
MDADEVQSYLQDDDNLSQQGEEEAAEGNVEASGSPQDDAPSADRVIALAEKYFDRVDAAQMLELLPEHTPVASLLRYFQIVLEYGTAQKRNLQVYRDNTAFTVARLLIRGGSTLLASDHSPAAAGTRGANSHSQLNEWISAGFFLYSELAEVAQKCKNRV